MIGLSFVKDISILEKDKAKNRILILARCKNDSLANSSKKQHRKFELHRLLEKQDPGISHGNITPEAMLADQPSVWLSFSLI